MLETICHQQPIYSIMKRWLDSSAAVALCLFAQKRHLALHTKLISTRTHLLTHLVEKPHACGIGKEQQRRRRTTSRASCAKVVKPGVVAALQSCSQLLHAFVPSTVFIGHQTQASSQLNDDRTMAMLFRLTCLDRPAG